MSPSCTVTSMLFGQNSWVFPYFTLALILSHSWRPREGKLIWATWFISNGKIAHSHIQPPPARTAWQPCQQSSHVSALLDHRVRLRNRDLCVGRVWRRTRVDEGASHGTVKLYSYLVALGKKHIPCLKTQVSVYNWFVGVHRWCHQILDCC